MSLAQARTYPRSLLLAGLALGLAGLALGLVACPGRQSYPDAASTHVARDAAAGDGVVADRGGVDVVAIDTRPGDTLTVDTLTADALAADGLAEDGSTPFPTTLTLGGARPALLKIPAGYDAVTPLPLIVFLHGYTSSAENHDRWWGMSERVDLDRFFLLLPDGTQESSPSAHRFWNATGACCNRFGSDVDDVGYLIGLVDEASDRVVVDPNRIHAVGHSNGGFMSFRLACDAADRFAAIADLAGATLIDETDCQASAPVSVLHVHGDADTLVRFEGDATGGVYRECEEGYPGAVESARRWAERADCDLAAAVMMPPIDLSPSIPGDETSVLRYASGCAGGVEVERWIIGGGAHSPSLGPDWAERLVGWLLQHGR